MYFRAANWICAFALAPTEHMISASHRFKLAHRGRNANTTDPLIDKRKQITMAFEFEFEWVKPCYQQCRSQYSLLNNVNVCLEQSSPFHSFAVLQGG